MRRGRQVEHFLIGTPCASHVPSRRRQGPACYQDTACFGGAEQGSVSLRTSMLIFCTVEGLTLNRSAPLPVHSQALKSPRGGRPFNGDYDG